MENITKNHGQLLLSFTIFLILTEIIFASGITASDTKISYFTWLTGIILSISSVIIAFLSNYWKYIKPIISKIFENKEKVKEDKTSIIINNNIQNSSDNNTNINKNINNKNNNSQTQQIILQNEEPINLSRHPLFSEIDYYLQYETKKLNFICEYRTELFRTMLMCYFKAFKDILYKTVKKQDKLNDMNEGEYQILFKTAIEEIEAETKNQMLLHHIMPVIVSKYFEESQKLKEQNLTSIIQFTETDFIKEVFADNKIKLTKHILNWFRKCVPEHFRTVYQTLASFNGTLKGFTYNNITCKMEFCQYGHACDRLSIKMLCKNPNEIQKNN